MLIQFYHLNSVISIVVLYIIRNMKVERNDLKNKVIVKEYMKYWTKIDNIFTCYKRIKCFIEN